MVTTLDNDTGQQPAKPHEASAVMEFVVGELRSNPELSYAEAKARAHLNGFELFPIVYGRAKAALGLVKAKPNAHHVRKPTTGLLPGIVERAEEPLPRGPGRALGPAMQFAVAALEKDPQATNGEVGAAAEEASLSVTPQIMLRARTRLGLPGQRQAAKQRAAAEPTVLAPTAAPQAPRTRPRAARSADTTSLDLDSLVASIREMEAERNRLRDALERIVAIIEELV